MRLVTTKWSEAGVVGANGAVDDRICRAELVDQRCMLAGVALSALLYSFAMRPSSSTSLSLSSDIFWTRRRVVLRRAFPPALTTESVPHPRPRFAPVIAFIIRARALSRPPTGNKVAASTEKSALRGVLS